MNEQNEEGHRLLTDWNHYIEMHGLASVDASNDGLSALEYSAARKRVSEEQKYQASVHAAIFKANSDTDEKGRSRRLFLDSLHADTIDIQTSTEVIRYAPLRPLADKCDTIYTLASSRHIFRGGHQGNNNHFHFSLESFDIVAVKEFLSLVLRKKGMEDVSCDLVVDCCQIAHYLQCSSVLNAMVDIMIRSIDSANCLSLCQLADRLNLSLLFERSLSYMMRSLGSLDDIPDLTDELRERIAVIQGAIQSSVHSQRSQLYFGSLNEYLAIFAENVQYQQERLVEAKIGLEGAGSGEAYKYAADKIAKQEERVRTLKAVLEEQKKMFTCREEPPSIRNHNMQGAVKK